MKVSVRFSNLVANIAGCGEAELVLPEGASFRQLLDTLVDKYGEDFRDLLFTRHGRLRPLAHIVVDGQDVAQLGGLDASIIGCTQVTVVVSVPAMSGG